MKARIYTTGNKYFDNWTIVLKYPKKLREEDCDGTFESLHLGHSLCHCMWGEHKDRETYHGKYVHFDKAPKEIQKRARKLEKVWNEACEKNDFTKWNRL